MRNFHGRGGWGWLVGIALAMCCSPKAMAISLDSIDFNHKYEGDTLDPLEISGYDVIAPPIDGSWSTDGDILTIKNSIAASGGYMLANWGDLDTNPVSNENGWTIEFRIRIDTDEGEEGVGANGAFQLVAKDVFGNNPQGRNVVLNLRANSTVLPIAAGAPTISTTSNSDDFHVYRIAQDPSSSWTRIWKNNDLIFDALSRGSNDSNSGNAALLRMFWRSAFGTSYPPDDAEQLVPEPSSLALLVGCGLMLLGMARAGKGATQ